MQEIGKNTTRKRADKWVREKYPQVSRTLLEEGFEQGFFLEKGFPAKKNFLLDHCPETSRFDEALHRLKNTEVMPVKVLQKEDSYWLVDKPSGLPTHPLHLKDHDTLSQRVLALSPEARASFEDSKDLCLVPHRLDVGTSGLQIVCLTQESLWYWRGVFSEHQVEKEYLAVSVGIADFQTQTVEAWIGKITEKEYGIVGTKSKVRSYPAKTDFEVLKTYPEQNLTLFKAKTSTGVTHQVRIHLKYLGIPILGDSVYGEAHPDYRWHELRAVRLKTPDREFKVDYSIPETWTRLENI